MHNNRPGMSPRSYQTIRNCKRLWIPSIQHGTVQTLQLSISFGSLIPFILSFSEFEKSKVSMKLYYLIYLSLLWRFSSLSSLASLSFTVSSILMTPSSTTAEEERDPETTSSQADRIARETMDNNPRHSNPQMSPSSTLLQPRQVIMAKEEQISLRSQIQMVSKENLPSSPMSFRKGWCN